MALENFDITGNLFPLESTNLAPNFTFQELVDATYMLPEEWKVATHIPFDSRLIAISQAIRDEFGKAVKWMSAYRTYAYDEFKGHNSIRKTHSRSLAVDIAGSGLVQWLYDHKASNSAFWQKLVSMGLSSIGFYFDQNFVHIDVDTPLASGRIRTWTRGKKKVKA